MGKSENQKVESYELSYWEKMYRDVEYLKSEMKFFSQEMAFLHSLLDRYLLWLIEQESLSGLQMLNAKVKSTDQKCSDFMSKADSLMNRLGLLIENPFTQDEHKIKDSFSHIMEETKSFLEDVKRIKSEVFDHVAHTLRTEKARRLLGEPQQGAHKL